MSKRRQGWWAQLHRRAVLVGNGMEISLQHEREQVIASSIRVRQVWRYR